MTNEEVAKFNKEQRRKANEEFKTIVLSAPTKAPIIIFGGAPEGFHWDLVKYPHENSYYELRRDEGEQG